MDNKQKFGLLTISSMNIGDEIQNIAARRFIPEIYKYIHRERISKYKFEDKIKLIMNAWWMWQPANCCPDESIDPLLIAMHFTPTFRNKILSNKKYKQFLIKKGPVGCRDKGTAEFLNKNGIPAYFSGCLTLTLQRNSKIKKKDFVLLVDMPKHIEAEIKKRTSRPVYNISNEILPSFAEMQRYEIAEMFLYLYQSAHCVITNRLHVAMPSLALETPILMLDTPTNHIKNDVRYTGLKDLCNYITEKEFMDNKDAYNFENPPENPDTYKTIRENLIKKCSEFTGFNNKESQIKYLDDETILLKLFSFIENNYLNTKRTFWYVRLKDFPKLLFLFISYNSTIFE